MLNAKTIRLILLGPPVLTIIILAGCFNKNNKIRNIKNNKKTCYYQNRILQGQKVITKLPSLHILYLLC